MQTLTTSLYKISCLIGWNTAQGESLLFIVMPPSARDAVSVAWSTNEPGQLGLCTGVWNVSRYILPCTTQHASRAPLPRLLESFYCLLARSWVAQSAQWLVQYFVDLFKGAQRVMQATSVIDLSIILFQCECTLFNNFNYHDLTSHKQNRKKRKPRPALHGLAKETARP